MTKYQQIVLILYDDALKEMTTRRRTTLDGLWWFDRPRLWTQRNAWWAQATTVQD